MKERTFYEIIVVLRAYTSISLKDIAKEFELKYSSLISARARNSIPYRKINLFCLKYGLDVQSIYFEAPEIKSDGFNQSDIYDVQNILKELENE